MRVAGRYEIQRLLGSGGMASVHLARQPALDREVALKELHSVHVADGGPARRFLRESRLAGALSHPNVVSVIEYFEHDGVPFIAMEYLERGSLRPLVGRLTVAQAGGVLEGILSGLEAAAAQGIVHRDLKPENVLITADGHVKIADFGIAKALGEVPITEFRTTTGQVIGTPAYMAPEQASAGAITPAADLYAVGLIAYELLAGRHPFHDCDAPLALLMRHAAGPPPALAAERPDLPARLLAWVGSMLQKDPSMRPAGAAAAWDELEGVLCEALGPRWRKESALPDEPVAASSEAKTAREPRRRRATASAAAALVLPLVVAAIAIAMLPGRGAGAAGPPPARPLTAEHHKRATDAPTRHERTRRAAASHTARATAVAAPRATPASTPTATPTSTPTITATPTSTPTPTPTATPSPTATPTATPAAIDVESPTVHPRSLGIRRAIRRAILRASG